MAKKSTVQKLNKRATLILKFGGEKHKVEYPRLSEFFAQLQDGSHLEKQMIFIVQKQLGYR